jgi:hypothetical protein
MKTIAVTGLALAGLAAMGALAAGQIGATASNNGPEGDVVVDAMGNLHVPHAYQMAHSTAKCNGEIFGVEENLTRSSVAKYLSGARVEFVLDPLDIDIRHNREIGTFWEVLSE